jgi:L-Ala-D/L-Glu epimerase
MRLQSICIYQLRIPLRASFHHALHNRDESDAVVVKVTDEQGRVGYGEGLPRPYVTGEDVDSMTARLQNALAPAVLAGDLTPGREVFEFLRANFNDWTAVKNNDKGVTAWNAAFCAIELALIDWSLAATCRSLSDVLIPARKEVLYSGVVSADDPATASATAKRFVGHGIVQLKIKVGTPEDVARVAAVRTAVGASVELRADANAAWAAEEAIERLDALRPFGLSCIEQPVAADDIDGMRRVRERAGIKVMADESLVTRAQARRLIEDQACDLFNIRVSKCGGISGSLDIAELARRAGVGIQVGAQVGETAILTAAGRHLAAHLPEIAYVEGSFGTLLLSEDISVEDLAFGYQGVAPILSQPGLGITIREEALERFTVRKIEVE